MRTRQFGMSTGVFLRSGRTRTGSWDWVRCTALVWIHKRPERECWGEPSTKECTFFFPNNTVGYKITHSSPQLHSSQLTAHSSQWQLSGRRGVRAAHTVPIRGDLSRGQDDRRCAPYWIGHSPTCSRTPQKCRSGHPRPVTRLWEGPPLGFRILAVRFWGKLAPTTHLYLRGFGEVEAFLPGGLPGNFYSISNTIQVFLMPR